MLGAARAAEVAAAMERARAGARAAMGEAG